MFPDERFLRVMLVLLGLFIPVYLWLAWAFFSCGDSVPGILCLAWVGLIVLVCRGVRCVLRDGKDDDYE